MSDYASVLHRVILALEPNTAAARQEVYERARRALWSRLRGGDPPVPEPEAAREAEALETAIRSVEIGMRQAAAAAPAASGARAAAGSVRSPAQPARRRPAPAWTVAAMVLLAALISGAIVFFTRGDPPPGSRRAEATRVEPATAESADAAPGVPYWFRRQPVFYRSIYPAGTVVIAKSQNFIYLVQGNTTALRYGMAIGPDCLDAAGMFELADGDPATDRAGTRLAGVGVPAEVPALHFGNDRYRIEATNVRDSIGRPLPSGCIRMMHADAVDLQQRITAASRVVVQ